MNGTQHLQRLIGAVIVMIACLAASPAAFAHAGHEHTDAAAVSSNTVPVIEVGTPVDADRGVAAAAESRAEASPAIPASKSKRCTGGCCTSSHACCAFNLPINAGPPYSLNGDIRAVIEPPLRDGLDPEALRKPPRSRV